jgi:hypothetical protein
MNPVVAEGKAAPPVRSGTMTDELRADHGYSEERIREFVVLAEQILDNAWARRNVETTVRYLRGGRSR